MAKFLVRRLLFAFLTIIFATALVFTLSRLAGDPLLLYAKPGGYGFSKDQEAALKKKLGLDKPFVMQYVVWLGLIGRGDFGKTILDEKAVSKVVTEKIPASAQLGVFAWVLATVIGVPIGVFAAVKRGSKWDYVARVFAIFGQALPSFWLGLILIFFFAVDRGWLPAGTRGDRGWLDWKYAVLPAVTLGWGAAASYMRLTRSAMLEILDSEFIKLARAKGVGSRLVVWKHAFRNALIQPLTASAVILTSFLGGSIIVEQVFAWPGMGRQLITVINNGDFPVIMAFVLLYASLYVVANFLVDLSYGAIDPRIRYD
jgi:peptide/nickel transport system permease protein